MNTDEKFPKTINNSQRTNISIDIWAGAAPEYQSDDRTMEQTLIRAFIQKEGILSRNI